MQIVFSSNESVDLVLDSTPLAMVYQQIYKHLQHVTIPFRDWDNPFYFDNYTHQDLVKALVLYGNKISLNIDKDLCLAQDQNYFNAIHKIYEKNYRGDPAWLDFHEHIHKCEKQIETSAKILHIDYREKSGPLEKSFDTAWRRSATTKVKAGDVFVKWAELGKTPYGYWKNNEPIDVVRMCELIKPWLKLRPKILVALEDIDILDNIEVDKFESWWSQYSEVLCRHWDRPMWTTHDIFAVSLFGRVPNYQEIITQLKNNAKPVRVLL
jgi:hypothetical protein